MKENNDIKVKGIVDELRYYSIKDDSNGKIVIPILVDFDYTVTKVSSWEEGTFVINEDCFDIMRKWNKLYGVKIILDTMREGANLRAAEAVFQEKGITLFGVGENPLQAKGDGCTGKIWGIFSIDDRNVGVPLVKEEGKRPYVDWKEVDRIMTPIFKEISKELN